MNYLFYCIINRLSKVLARIRCDARFFKNFSSTIWVNWFRADLFRSYIYAAHTANYLHQSDELIASSLLVRVIRSTALNATTRIRARQKLPTIIERLRKLAENLFFTDDDLFFLRTFTWCAIINFYKNYTFFTNWYNCICILNLIIILIFGWSNKNLTNSKL